MQNPFRLFSLLPLFVFATFQLSAQTQFWSDDFEDAGSPSSGSRTPSTTVLCGGPPATAYFNRVATSSISTGSVYTGFSGSKFWASEDIDKGPTCVNNSIPAHQNITWSSINIAGKSGLSFKGLFAVGTTTAFDGFGFVNSGGTSVYDYLIVQYRIDGGAWIDLLRFFPSINNAGNGTLALETTGDSIAQGEGAGLTTAAAEFTANIIGTGTTLELQVKMHSNSAAEETLIDYFRLFETPACTNPSITSQPSNASVCNGNNTSFAVSATGATGYQWQVNSGAGFSNISNGGVYSTATTSSLTITGATSGMNGYTYRCVTSNSTCTTTSNAVTLTVSTPSLTAASQTNVSCFGGAAGAATVNTATGGIAAYTYNWTPGNPTGDGTVSVTGLTAGTWTCTVTDNIGCTAQRSFTITQPALNPGSGTYSLPTTNQSVTQTVNNYNYSNGTCELMTAVVASGASPVSGEVANKVWIESSVPTHASIPFVQRHYEITPTTNASTATGTVTLFFTQTEFDNFNAHPNSGMDLPTGPSDNQGKSNLRIGKYSGVSGNGTGLPSSYSSTAMVIDPDDANIVWNATASAWEVTFTVNGFSGFVVQTVSATLPVTFRSFDVNQKGKDVVLNWTTEMEQNSRTFQVQHSLNATDWTTLSFVAAAGNSNTLKNYAHLHRNAPAGINYYRIVQQDQDGKTFYSEVKTIRLEAQQASIHIVTTPVQNGQVQLTVTGNAQTIRLYNMQGHVLLTRYLEPGTHRLNVSHLAKAMYWLKGEQNTEKLIIQ